MKQKAKQTLVILDAHALIHRSYHAMPSFASPSGEPMGAVYGVAAVLLKLFRDLEPTHIVAAFDREEPTFRHIAYEQYKATRQETKSDLVPQFDKTKELFRAFNVPVLEAPGFEADDIIGTLVDRLKKEKNLSIIIASGDMDTLQLVDDARVRVYTLRKGIDDTIMYDEGKVVERFGFKPALIIDFKGLKGDPSDNIIGVRGIGEKTATELIKEYGTLEDMYKRLKKEKKHPAWLKERVRALLLENEEEALFSKELATIRKDAPVDVSLDHFQYRGIPVDEVTRVFRAFYFPSLISRLPKQKTLLQEPSETVLSATFDDKIADTIPRGASISLFRSDDDVMCAYGDAAYRVPKEFLPSLRDRIIAQDLAVTTDDAKTLFSFCGVAFPVAFDIRIASWIVNPERRIFSLDDLIAEECGRSAKSIVQNIPILAEKLRRRIQKDGLGVIYDQFELPLIPILFEMEQIGVRVDAVALTALKAEVARELEELERTIWGLAGEEFDINSPKQLSRILFETLALSPKGIKKTSTKSISTQASELVKLRGAHAIIDPLLKYRELSKLSSTYISVLPTLIDGKSRIHTTFQQTGTATGRLSSSDPNLQNIPIRTDLGKRVRSAFVADPGYRLISFDYSQLELRIAAALSGDVKLIGAFRDRQDIHTRTAMEIFHVDAGGVTSEMRRRAKTINFGILYGMGARALAQGMGVSFAEAEGYLEEYLREFPGIEEYRERITALGRSRGFVETIFGRRRYLPNLKSRFEYVRAEAERMAMNAPIQGTEADLIKRAMIRIWSELGLKGRDDVRMLLQVHDELLFEVCDDIVDDIVPRIIAIMEDVPELSVPIVVDAKAGADWQNMKML